MDESKRSRPFEVAFKNNHSLLHRIPDNENKKNKKMKERLEASTMSSGSPPIGAVPRQIAIRPFLFFL